MKGLFKTTMKKDKKSREREIWQKVIWGQGYMNIENEYKYFDKYKL